MGKTITITVPDTVHRAIQVKGQMLEMGAGDYLKQFVMASAMGAELPLRLKLIMDRMDGSTEQNEEQEELHLIEEGE